MRNLKDKLKDMDRDVQQKWQAIDETPGISTREKLEKLVEMNLRRKLGSVSRKEKPAPPNSLPEELDAVVVREYQYNLDAPYKRIRLNSWTQVTRESLHLISRNPQFLQVDPARIVFFDTETTGLAGGTGTVPFMYGFGYFAGDFFRSTVFILTDLAREADFLARIDGFLEERRFSAVVTFNGNTFDMPLVEARYILQRRRSPLHRLPHLDFLTPARMIWKHTFESRRLGYLAEMLLDISRSEDIDGSQIPSLYFEFLRTRRMAMLASVIEHNALDLLSLAGLLLLAVFYTRDISWTSDVGEILGLSRVFERMGDWERTEECLRIVSESATREPVRTDAVKRLGRLLKSRKLYHEAIHLWQILADSRQEIGFRELSIHYEHREKNPLKALEIVEKAFESMSCGGREQVGMEKRLRRLRDKLAKWREEEESDE